MSSDDNNDAKKKTSPRFTQEQLDAILNIEQPPDIATAPATDAPVTDNSVVDARLLAHLRSSLAQVAQLEAVVYASKQNDAEREAEETQAEAEREKDKAYAERLFDRNQAIMRMQEKIAAMDGRTLSPQFKEIQMAMLSSRKELDYQQQAMKKK